MDLLDLPDEILCAILNKLNMIDVFDSLVDVDERFDRLVFDPLFTHHVDLVLKPLISNSSSIDDQRLDRVCTKILPRINCHVSKLTLDPLSLERVLATADYPHLHTLSLIHFPAETLLSQLKGMLENSSRNSIAMIWIFQMIPHLFVFSINKLQNFPSIFLKRETNQLIHNDH